MTIHTNHNASHAGEGPSYFRRSLKRRLVVVFVSAAFALALAFVFQTKMMEAPSLDQSKLPQYKDPALPIEVRPGSEFTIVLESNPTTGYGWKISDDLDKTKLVVTEVRHRQDKKKLLGSPGKDFWTFRTLNEGTAAIAFEYVRPWEKDVPPVKRSIFTLVIKK